VEDTLFSIDRQEIIEGLAKLGPSDLVYIRSCIDKLISLKTPEDCEDELLQNNK
jgi:hypothetical protein